MKKTNPTNKLNTMLTKAREEGWNQAMDVCVGWAVGLQIGDQPGGPQLMKMMRECLYGASTDGMD